MLAGRAETLRSAQSLPRTVEVEAVLAQVLLRLVPEVAEAVSAQRVQAPVRLVLTEAVAVAMVLLQQASFP